MKIGTISCKQSNTIFVTWNKMIKTQLYEYDSIFFYECKKVDDKISINYVYYTRIDRYKDIMTN